MILLCGLCVDLFVPRKKRKEKNTQKCQETGTSKNKEQRTMNNEQ